MIPDIIVDRGVKMCKGPSPEDKPLPNQFESIGYTLTSELKNNITCPSLKDGNCQGAGGEVCIFKRLAGQESFEGSPVLLVGAQATDFILDQSDRTVRRVPAGRLPSNEPSVALPGSEWNTLIELVKHAGEYVSTPTLIEAASRGADAPPILDTSIARSNYMRKTIRFLRTTIGSGLSDGVAPLIQTDRGYKPKGSRLVMPHNVRV